jgi:ribosome maturation factor RimP
MNFKEKVSTIINEILNENPSIFLVNLEVDDSNKIVVALDGDNGINLQDCINISRSIESELDKEANDFSIEVASAGVSTPLKFVRQYKKNIGRTLKIKTDSEKIEAELIEADDNKIVLSWISREPKKVGKGKETIINKKEFLYSEIKEAVVTINFN